MFRFKQFTIEQDHCAMKVGTDGVLLGAWARVEPSDRRMLDIGTGTGLIALMLAQRSAGAYVAGIDIDSVVQAQENAARSPWARRVQMRQCAVQEFRADEPFDLIVSNPPFFVDSLTCPDPGRTRVRHAVSLPFDALHDAVVRLLAPGGRFCLVLPPPESDLFVSHCHGIYPVRRTEVRSTPDSGVRRVLTEFQRISVPCVSDSLVIGTGVHEEYTPEYRELTRDFYLKF